MSRIVSDLIRSKVEADAIDGEAATMLTWLISDKLPADAGLDEIDRAIGQAREGFGPLFRKRKPAPEAKPPTGMRAAPRDRSADRIKVATSGGNPWAAGTINHTRQAMVEAADPELAAKLRAEAGH